MGADPNFFIDLDGAKCAGDDLQRIAGAMAALYADFGGRTGFDPGQIPATILGCRDPLSVSAPADPLPQLPGGAGHASDVTDAWDAFCRNWGEFIDDAVGVTSAMADALWQSASVYTSQDDKAAEAVTSTDPSQRAFAQSIDAKGDIDVGKFAHLTILSTPPGAQTPNAAVPPARGDTALGEVGRQQHRRRGQLQQRLSCQDRR